MQQSELLKAAATRDAVETVADFSLVLGGPLYQLYLRTRLLEPPLDLVRRRIMSDYVRYYHEERFGYAVTNVKRHVRRSEEEPRCYLFSDHSIKPNIRTGSSAKLRIAVIRFAEHIPPLWRRRPRNVSPS